jgi:hypothetical protein
MKIEVNYKSFIRNNQFLPGEQDYFFQREITTEIREFYSLLFKGGWGRILSLPSKALNPPLEKGLEYFNPQNHITKLILSCLKLPDTIFKHFIAGVIFILIIIVIRDNPGKDFTSSRSQDI